MRGMPAAPFRKIVCNSVSRLSERFSLSDVKATRRGAHLLLHWSRTVPVEPYFVPQVGSSAFGGLHRCSFTYFLLAQFDELRWTSVFAKICRFPLIRDSYVTLSKRELPDVRTSQMAPISAIFQISRVSGRNAGVYGEVGDMTVESDKS